MAFLSVTITFMIWEINIVVVTIKWSIL